MIWSQCDFSGLMNKCLSVWYIKQWFHTLGTSEVSKQHFCIFFHLWLSAFIYLDRQLVWNSDWMEDAAHFSIRVLCKASWLTPGWTEVSIGPVNAFSRVQCPPEAYLKRWASFESLFCPEQLKSEFHFSLNVLPFVGFCSSETIVTMYSFNLIFTLLYIQKWICIISTLSSVQSSWSQGLAGGRSTNYNIKSKADSLMKDEQIWSSLSRQVGYIITYK